jgi:hypothetical protein
VIPSDKDNLPGDRAGVFSGNRTNSQLTSIKTSSGEILDLSKPRSMRVFAYSGPDKQLSPSELDSIVPVDSKTGNVNDGKTHHQDVTNKDGTKTPTDQKEPVPGGGMSLSSVPDANMYALATGPNNKQLVIRLTMNVLKGSDTSGQNGKLRGQAAPSGRTNPLGSAYNWEIVGQFNEECPYNDPGKVGTDQEDSSRLNETRPKLQSLLALEDGSLVYTCERSNVIIKHPNRGSTQSTHQIPEVNIALKSFLADEFDKGSEKDNLKEKENYNNEYGISLVYNSSHNLIYVGFED